MDPNGSIPTFIKNSLAAKRADMIVAL